MSPEQDGLARRQALSPILAIAEFRPLSATVSVEFAADSYQGHPKYNEDHYLIQTFGRTQDTVATSLPKSDLPQRFEERAYAMVVADGLGGAGPGSLASRVALSTLAHLALHFGRWNLRVDAATASQIADRAEWFYRRTHEVLREKGCERSETRGMATSLTAAYSAGDELFVAHVGHSRAYLLRQGELRQLTHDQTVANRLVASARPLSVPAGADDLRHILTDTIGGPIVTPQVEIERHHLRNGDCIMLCTDGLTDHVSADAIADVLAPRRSLPEQTRSLIDLAVANGADDNVTIVLAQYTIPVV